MEPTTLLQRVQDYLGSRGLPNRTSYYLEEEEIAEVKFFPLIIEVGEIGVNPAARYGWRIDGENLFFIRLSIHW